MQEESGLKLPSCALEIYENTFLRSPKYIAEEIGSKFYLWQDGAEYRHLWSWANLQCYGASASLYAATRASGYNDYAFPSSPKFTVNS